MSKLLSGQEAANYLSVSSRSLSNARSSGTGIVIPFIKIGGAVRYKQSDLDNYIQANTFNHTGESRGTNV
ncbi:MAG: helix-turn-helix domain-containing protein [Candidatus Thioglobus sp.]|jgi:excisionase family DNA binding protein